MMRADASIRKFDIKRLYSFMYGSPGDTEEALRSYTDFAIKMDPFIFLVQPTMAFPGTALYEYAIEHNLLNDPKWFYSFLSPNSDDPFQARIMSKDLSPEIVDKYVKQAYLKFYLRPSKVYEYLKYYSLERFTSAIAMKFFSFLNKNHSFKATYRKEMAS